MNLQFLGTANCAGIPVYGCDCMVCSGSRKDTTLQRQPACGKLYTSSQTLLIDAGLPDLATRIPRNTIDRILLTHFHVDHVQGLFHIRWGACPQPLPVHGPADPDGCADLLKHPGILDFSETFEPFQSTTFADITVTALPLNHSKPTLGYSFRADNAHIAWLTDTSGLPDTTLEYLQSHSPDIMVLDCSFPPQPEPHPNHNDITAALKLHDIIHPQKTYFIHIGHEVEQWLYHNKETLPDGIIIPRDGDVISTD